MCKDLLEGGDALYRTRILRMVTIQIANNQQDMNRVLPLQKLIAEEF